MVESDAAGVIEQDQSRRRAGPIKIEILFTDRDRNTLQRRIEMLPDAFDVGKFILRLRIFSLRRVTVELRGSEQHQTAPAELGAQLRDHGAFSFTVAAPMCPEKKQHRRTIQLG